MAQQGSSGFDMSKVSTGSKILLGAGVLLLLDSFLSWQEVCASDFVGGDVADLVGDVCASANMWSGNGGFAGLIAGLLVIALIAWEIMSVAGVSMDVGMGAGKISAYVGFGVLAFVVLKVILVISNEIALGAWIGLVLALVIGYGAWMRMQEPETSAPPSAPPASPPPPQGGVGPTG